ncbi:hypothetical protein I4F81_000460 [Pyropia yezoensis]|uniref:Uncharacterized protein n=1 Tax=Pyropia yezoensis TaxID=2788 RepID=A0ACC3BJC1_PYRYE|nr:hypothetical protein I4F81_000460 [Neopyropia yezoensis]
MPSSAAPRCRAAVARRRGHPRVLGIDGTRRARPVGVAAAVRVATAALRSSTGVGVAAGAPAGVDGRRRRPAAEAATAAAAAAVAAAVVATAAAAATAAVAPGAAADSPQAAGWGTSKWRPPSNPPLPHPFTSCSTALARGVCDWVVGSDSRAPAGRNAGGAASAGRLLSSGGGGHRSRGHHSTHGLIRVAATVAATTADAVTASTTAATKTAAAADAPLG